MSLKQDIERGKFIDKLDKRIQSLEKEVEQLKQEQEDSGVKELKSTIKHYEEFFDDLMQLMRNYGII